MHVAVVLLSLCMLSVVIVVRLSQFGCMLYLVYRYHLISVHDTPIFWKRLLDNVAVLGALTKYTRDMRGTNQCMCAKTQTRRKHWILPFVVTTACLSIECGYTAARAYTQTHTTSSDARQKYSGSNIQNTNVWFSLIRTDDVLRAYLLLIVLKICFFSQFFFWFSPRNIRIDLYYSTWNE